MDDCQIRETGGAGVIAAGTGRVEMDRVRVVDVPGTGLAVVEDAELRVRGGTVARTGANGVHATDRCTVRLTECEISTTAYTALHIAGNVRAELRSCTVRDSAQHAVRVEGAADFTAEDTRIERARMTGVDVKDADAVLRALVVADTDTGIRLDSRHRPLLADCGGAAARQRPASRSRRAAAPCWWAAGSRDRDRPASFSTNAVRPGSRTSPSRTPGAAAW